MSVRKMHRAVLARVSVAVGTAVVLLGGCVASGESSEDVNKKLPRMKKEDAESWARHFIDSMARTAGVDVSEKTVNPAFTKCVGRNDEVAEDGRYTLDLRARSVIDKNDQTAAVEKIHKELKQRSYRIVSFEKRGGARHHVILDAESREHNFFVAVEGNYKHADLLFTVSTPCLLPPGVKQQEF